MEAGMGAPFVSCLRQINAGEEEVWRALAEPAALAGWLLPPALAGAARLNSDQTLEVTLGPPAVALARCEWDPARRTLRLTGLPDEETTVEFSVEPGAGGDALRVHLRAFVADPRRTQPSEERGISIAAAAPRLLDNLNAFVTGVEAPWPEGYVAALLGYRLDGPQRWGIERTIHIPAPIARVWLAVSRPEDIEGWFSPGTPWTLTELAPGGRLFVSDAESGAELYTQIVHRVEAPRLLMLHGLPDETGGMDWSDYRLAEERGGTRLSFALYGYERWPEAQRAAAQEQHAIGFGVALANVRALVLGEPLPNPGGF